MLRTTTSPNAIRFKASDLEKMTTGFSVEVDPSLRPANATLLAYETEEQHQSNVAAKLTEHAQKVAAVGNSVEAIPLVTGLFLLELRNDYNKGTITYNTFKAVVAKINNNPYLCSEIVTSGIKIKSNDNDPRTKQVSLLGYAMQDRDPTKLELLLNCGIDPNTPEDIGYAPIHIAAQYSPEHIPVLVKYKADLNLQTSNEGYTALHLAAGVSKPESVAALLKAGASHTTLTYVGKHNEFNKNEGEPAIVYALPHLPTLKAFFDNGVSPHQKYGPNKFTILKYAQEARRRNTLSEPNVPNEVMKFLVESEANTPKPKHNKVIGEESGVTIKKEGQVLSATLVGFVLAIIILASISMSKIWIIFKEQLNNRSQSAELERRREEDLLYQHHSLNQLTKDILEGDWVRQKSMTNAFSLKLKLSSAAPTKDFDQVVKVLKKILEKKYGTVNVENNELKLVVTKPAARIESDLDRKDLLADFSKFSAYEKMLDAFSVAELVELKQITFADYERTVTRFKTKVENLKVGDKDRNKRNADTIKRGFKGIEIYKDEVKNINPDLTTILSEAKTNLAALKTLPFDQANAKGDALVKETEAKFAKVKQTLRNYASYLAERTSEIEKEFLNFVGTDHPEKKRAPAEVKPQATTVAPPAPPIVAERAETPVIVVAPVAPTLPERPPSPPKADTRHDKEQPIAVIPSKKVSTFEGTPTLFAFNENNIGDKNTPKLHATAAHQYACNMRAILNDHSDLTEDEYLYSLLYNVMRLIATLWHITLHLEDENRVKDYIETMRHIVVHGATRHVGTKVKIEHVEAAARHLEATIPVIFDVAFKDKVESSIIKKTLTLIDGLKLKSLELIKLSSAEIELTPQLCKDRIKQALDSIASISDKGFSTPDEVDKNPGKAGAVKMLIVIIGEYWKAYSEMQGEQHSIENLSVKTLNECCARRNDGCHFRLENADRSCFDIKAPALLSLFNKLKANRRHVREEADEVAYVAAHALVPPRKPGI